jgi:hypothetical protein
MSLVTSRVALRYRCTIERQTAAPRDAWNQKPAPAEWQPHLTDVPCRYWVTTGSERVSGGETIVSVVEAHVIVPLATDVTTRDRVASVTYRGGNIQEQPQQVRAVITRADHLELLLTKVG